MVSYVLQKELFMHFLWLFLLGSFLGYLIEFLEHLIKKGEFLSKPGLWFGPLKPIYGIGLILITLTLFKIRNLNIFFLFIISMVIGTIFEYLCALFQEKCFSTYTWSYHGNKIAWPYSIAWGILSILWIRILFPIYLRLWTFLNNDLCFKISILIAIFLTLDIILTSLIIKRYASRKKKKKATSKIDKILDKYFSNQKVEQKFPNLGIK